MTRTQGDRRVWFGLALLGIFAVAATGGWYASGYGTDDRGIAWMRAHLDVIDRHVNALARRLRASHDRHGRYPTNDEGLALVMPPAGEHVTVHLSGESGGWLWSWHTHDRERTLMRHFRDDHGRMPGNEAELREALLITPRDVTSSDEDPDRACAVAVLGDGERMLIDGGEVLSPWRVPYVYENRRDAPAAAFAESPAEEGLDERYAVRVDDGIYVWSAGGRMYADELRPRVWKRRGLRLFGVGLLAVAAGGAVWLTLRSRRRRLAGVLGAVALAVGGAGGGLADAAHRMTCYIMMPVFNKEDRRQIVKQRRELLDRCHRRGVLSQQAYQRALRTLEPTDAATTRPDHGAASGDSDGAEEASH
ncbi:MAG: hypothetical protein KGY99_10890 [Phycisphaerae bacterium]|nr:hypothetical protein [Phycisphaerae bacterium]